jgi:hypothetical protein
VQAEAEAGAASPDDLLDENRVEAEVVLATAAVLLGDVRSEQAGLAGLAPYLTIDQTCLFPVSVKRYGLASQEFPT